MQRLEQEEDQRAQMVQYLEQQEARERKAQLLEQARERSIEDAELDTMDMI